MARVLIAWELGGAFGHLARCLRLAEGLRSRGHSVTMVLKDVRLPAGNGSPQGLTVLPAPLTPQRRLSKQRLPVNYADVLHHCGFADAQDVAARLAAWGGIFSLVRPDVLLADHAPTALLAAHLAGIPHLAVGNGFAIPPAIFPWPSIRPWEQIPDEDLVAAEQRLDRVTEATQKLFGHVAPVRIRDVFGAHDVLDTFAELDHYGARPNGRYVGLIGSIPDARRVDWQDREAQKVLAYLRPDVPGFTSIMSALGRLDAEVLCVAPGLTSGRARRFATQRLRIALAPVSLPELIVHTDLAVSYGSSGFVMQALLAGVPLSLCPRHVEQGLFGLRVEAMGAGKLLDFKADAVAKEATLQAMLSSPDHRQAAQAFRERHLHFSSEQAVDHALVMIEQTLAGRWESVVASHAREHQEKPPTCLH